MQVLSKTRPLRVLIALKRHQVKTLNDQLADLLELQAGSAAKARTAQATLQADHLQPGGNTRSGGLGTVSDEVNQEDSAEVPLSHTASKLFTFTFTFTP